MAAEHTETMLQLNAKTGARLVSGPQIYDCISMTLILKVYFTQIILYVYPLLRFKFDFTIFLLNVNKTLFLWQLKIIIVS